MKIYKYELKWNNKSVGKNFFTKKEAKKEFNRLWGLELYGYTICEY